MSLEQGHAALDAALGILSRLDSVQLAEIEKRAAFLRRAGGGPKVEVDSASRAVLDAIVEALRQRNLPSFSASKLSEGRDWEAFAKKARGLIHYLTDGTGLDLQGRLIVLRLGIRLFIKRLEEERQMITFNTLISQVHRIAPLLDQEFPGYARAGFLRLLIKQSA